jgi:hypothetical protein
MSSEYGRETMSPSLQGDKLGSKIRPKSEVIYYKLLKILCTI